MQRCPNCGHEVPLGTTVCPNCGAQLNNTRSNSGGGFMLLIALALLILLPPFIYNPIVTHKYLIKERYFDVSESGRKLAYWTSYLYIGLFVFFAYELIARGQTFQPRTVNWIVTILLLIIGASFLINILQTIVNTHRFWHGVGHFVLVIGFLLWSYVAFAGIYGHLTGDNLTFSKVTSSKLVGDNDSSKTSASHYSATNSSASEKSSAAVSTPSGSGAKPSAAVLAIPSTFKLADVRSYITDTLHFTADKKLSDTDTYTAVGDGIPGYKIRAQNMKNYAALVEAIDGAQGTFAYAQYNQKYGLGLKQGDWFVVMHNSQGDSAFKLTALDDERLRTDTSDAPINQ